MKHKQIIGANLPVDLVLMLDAVSSELKMTRRDAIEAALTHWCWGTSILEKLDGATNEITLRYDIPSGKWHAEGEIHGDWVQGPDRNHVGDTLAAVLGLED